MCDARMRPFRTINETEIACELDGPHNRHSGLLWNYAYQGSKTVISWDEHDRRCFHGQWPGVCPMDCLLPQGHSGGHAA